MKNDALVRKSDFADSGVNLGGKADAKSDAILEADAKCAAVQTSLVENRGLKDSTKKHPREQ